MARSQDLIPRDGVYKPSKGATVGGERRVRMLVLRNLREVFPRWACCGEIPEEQSGGDSTWVPVEAFVALLDHLAREHLEEPVPSLAQGHRHIGAAGFDAALRGPLGPVFAGMLQLGPERFVSRAAALSQRLSSFGQWSVVPAEAGRVRCQADETPIPVGYYAGMFERAFDRMGLREVQITTCQGADGFSLELVWDPVGAQRSTRANSLDGRLPGG